MTAPLFDQHPVEMERHFAPGLKTRPAVHVGSQTMTYFRGNPKEQAWESLHLAAAFDSDVVVVRDLDPRYLAYWTALMGPTQVVVSTAATRGDFLTQAILDSTETIELIKRAMDPQSSLMVFFPTTLEQELAERLAIPLHGSPAISRTYGTKSGIRALAQDCGIPMPPGFVCSTSDQVRDAMCALAERFERVVIKHDLSTGGAWSTRWNPRQIDGLAGCLDEIAGGRFIAGVDIVVVEGWIASKAALCAHIELVRGAEPLICAAWEQLIDTDGTSYIGAKPLTLSPRALASLRAQLNTLAMALYRRGAVGSFGPDFLVVADDETEAEPDTVLLLELNSRIPATAFPLEIVHRIRGKIGAGFYARHLKLTRPAPFTEVADALLAEGLLIMERAATARGVVPYNVGLLPWQLCDIVVMADDWAETARIVAQVDRVFERHPPQIARTCPSLCCPA